MAIRLVILISLVIATSVNAASCLEFLVSVNRVTTFDDHRTQFPETLGSPKVVAELARRMRQVESPIEMVRGVLSETTLANGQRVRSPQYLLVKIDGRPEVSQNLLAPELDSLYGFSNDFIAPFLSCHICAGLVAKPSLRNDLIVPDHPFKQNTPQYFEDNFREIGPDEPIKKDDIEVLYWVDPDTGALEPQHSMALVNQEGAWSKNNVGSDKPFYIQDRKSTLQLFLPPDWPNGPTDIRIRYFRAP